MIPSIHDDVESWTVNLTAQRLGEPHTWVRDWTRPTLAGLRDDVLAADWDWVLADDHSAFPDLPIAPNSTAVVATLSRLARLRSSQHTTSAKLWTPPSRILLAVGPGFDGHSPDLHTIARLGADVGIHLAVSAVLAESDRAPQEFRANIRGLWERCAITVHPSGGVLVRLLNAQPDRRELLGASTIVNLTTAGDVVSIEMLDGTIDVDLLLLHYHLSPSLVRLLRRRFPHPPNPGQRARL